jgi:hypothetical protein
MHSLASDATHVLNKLSKLISYRSTLPRSIPFDLTRVSASRKGEVGYSYLTLTHPNVQPSIQKLVGNLSTDCLTHLTEEAVHTDAYTQDTPGVKTALRDLQTEFSSAINPVLLAEALQKAPIRATRRKHMYNQTVWNTDHVVALK